MWITFLLFLSHHPFWLVVTVLLIIALSIQLYYYLYVYTGALRHNRKVTKNTVEFSMEKPPVSVVICAKNEEDNLQAFLPLVLEQDYPDYEVIVVNDGSHDDTGAILERFKERYPHLYVTHLPENIRVLSPKKLAMTVGIKAAKNEFLLFTDADCRPVSPSWISNMVRNFDSQTEFILGYGGYNKERSLINRLICYDTLFIAMQYLGFANIGKPYMGVGRNMAYRKSTFFKMRGFAGHLHIASGDDDLLVNSAANKHNTRIECSKESCTLSLPKQTFRDWFVQKRRHMSASVLYSKKSKRHLLIEPLSRGLFYINTILLCFSFQPILIIAAGVFFLIRYIVQCFVINLVGKSLNERRFIISIPLWDILLPIITLYLVSIDKILHRTKSHEWYK